MRKDIGIFNFMGQLGKKHSVSSDGSIRNFIIRDGGCDLAVEGFEIFSSIIIHHLNPITYEDILNCNPCVFDPDNVVCTKLSTHNAIHYGNENLLTKPPVERTRNDTCPWRR